MNFRLKGGGALGSALILIFGWSISAAGWADEMESVVVIGGAEAFDSYRCPVLTTDLIERAKTQSLEEARRACFSDEVYPLRSWEVTSTCEKTECCFGDITFTLRVLAESEFLCK
ncbi:MAG: hypothetical protein H6624_07055 [Bdellovibrionaceae bacterium]|nr:hypothetical protein [Bdellovibrionales bacterium]MCB9084085.1 hypothetical protein [Pseudobdellovibrionaceae bacterium]